MRRLIQSEWFQRLWGDRIILTGDQNAKTKFELKTTGFREAVAAGSITGSRGDYVIVDDPHSVESAASEAMRQSTAEWFLEALPTRLNRPSEGPNGEPASSIIVIMQRLHEQDISGIILDKQLGYTHLCLPMEFESDRRCETELGFVDPREDEGELLFPLRFPKEVVDRDKKVMGPYASAGQFQQRPSPRGGSIIKRTDWMLYDDSEAAAQGANSSGTYPAMDYIVASLDTAYTEKQENDASYLTIWGIWQRGGAKAHALLSSAGVRTELIEERDTLPAVMLMHAKEMRMAIHGPEVVRDPGETDVSFRRRQRESWGLCEWAAQLCNQFKVDKLLIEAKANGITVAQELKRLNRTQNWTVELVNPGALDKVARAYSVQAIFSNAQVWAPDRDWADKVITQCESFPRGKHDDAVDSTTQALRYLRERGLLNRQEDFAAQAEFEASYRPKTRPAYDV
jgi:predicted phage terminase large subunit-like protein